MRVRIGVSVRRIQVFFCPRCFCFILISSTSTSSGSRPRVLFFCHRFLCPYLVLAAAWGRQALSCHFWGLSFDAWKAALLANGGRGGYVLSGPSRPVLVRREERVMKHA